MSDTSGWRKASWRKCQLNCDLLMSRYWPGQEEGRRRAFQAAETACAKAQRPGTESLIRLRVELVSGHTFQPLPGGCVPAAPLALGRMRPWNAATAQSHRESTLDRGSWSSVCRLSEWADPSLPSGMRGRTMGDYGEAHSRHSLCKPCHYCVQP